MRRRVFACVAAATLIAPAAGLAQGRGGPVWTTSGGDAERTASMRTDPRISLESMQQPGFTLAWKRTFENMPRQLESLTAPVMSASGFITYKGFKAVAYIGGSADNVYAVDYDLNRMFWVTHLKSGLTDHTSTVQCPAALTSLTRATTITPPPAGRSGGRTTPAPGAAPGTTPPAGGAGGAPASRGGGAPAGLPAGAGAPAPPGAAAQPPGGGRGGRGAPPPGRGNENVYAISSGGMAHTINPQIGVDVVAPITFLSPGANVAGTAFVDGVLYAATTGNCGGTANGVWALDLSNDAHTVSNWDAQGAAIAGTYGLAVSGNGIIYTATGSGGSTYANALVALDGPTLKPTGWFRTTQPFTTSPLAFEHKGKWIVAAANADGRVYLVDGASPGGADHATALYKSDAFTNAAGATAGAGALATWLDDDNTRWVFATTGGGVLGGAPLPSGNGSATNGSVIAFKLVDQNGGLALERAWVSREIASPAPPLVINGVLFALSTGEFKADAKMPAAERAKRSKPAVLYALDAKTGKELWNSGTAITSFTHGIGPVGGDGTVLVATYDGTLYAFSHPVDR